MKLFTCTNCGQLVYFENDACIRCGFPLGFLPGSLELVSLNSEPDGAFSLLNEDGHSRFKYCFNHQYNACNWLVPVNSVNPFCRACELNSTIPDLNESKFFERWRTIEFWKHRLVYSLLRMRLPIVSRMADPQKGLSFDFLGDETGENKIRTGHEDGKITLNIAEADDIEREMARRNLHELYRTVLGHFRHEIGHYYWDQLIEKSSLLKNFRRLFGDERIDYSKSLEVYYRNGPPADWQDFYISGYASAHPWEDWAETWAHYLHILDTLETAYSFGVSVHPSGNISTLFMNAEIKVDPYRIPDFDSIIELWLPLTFAMNSLNRSMGLRDPYPFVISPEVMKKLAFIHEVCAPSESLASINKTSTILEPM